MSKKLDIIIQDLKHAFRIVSFLLKMLKNIYSKIKKSDIINLVKIKNNKWR